MKMYDMNTVPVRRSNLRSLVNFFGSQTELAAQLAGTHLTQPIISSIVRGRRTFQSSEMRLVERKLCIPEGWIEKRQFPRAWIHIRKLTTLDADSIHAIHALIRIAEVE